MPDAVAMIMCWRWNRIRKALRVYESKIHFQNSKNLVKIFTKNLEVRENAVSNEVI